MNYNEQQKEFDFITMMNVNKEASKLVDICGGPMSIKDSADELRHYGIRKPKYMVITMEKREDGRYQTVVYIDRPTFQNPKGLNTLVTSY